MSNKDVVDSFILVFSNGSIWNTSKLSNYDKLRGLDFNYLWWEDDTELGEDVQDWT